MAAAALHALPNATIMNLVAKVREPPYRDFVLELFRTDRKMPSASTSRTSPTSTPTA